MIFKLPFRQQLQSLTLFLLASSLLSPLATAETTANPQTQDEIVVTAKNQANLADTLSTSHLLTADEIDLAQAKDITTLLQEIPGINITPTGGRGSTTGVFLRGASASQTIVLIDGVRVGSATLGEAALNSYPIEAIQRIEVVKGPLSGIYGADAVGGVIQLFTQGYGITNDGFAGHIDAGYGSNSLQEYGLSLAFGGERNNLRVSAQIEETDGIDRTSITSGGNDDIDGFEQDSFSLGGRFSIGENTYLQISALGSDNRVEFDNTFGDDTGFFTDTETLSSALSLVTELNDVLRWRTTIGRNEDDSITPAFASEFNSTRESLSSELAWNISPTAQLIAGVDYYDESVTPLDSFPVNKRDNKGAFLLLQNNWERISALGNIRYDNNSAYGTETNGSVAVEFEISDRLSAVASYGTAFVAPSFNFLYFPFFGNPDLLPEESESFELGLRGTSQLARWRISAYKTDIENLFSFDPVTFLAANIGSAEIEGIEAEMSTVWNDWSLSATANVMAAEDRDSGIELDDRAQKTFHFSASRSVEKADFRFVIRAEQDRFDNRGTELSGFVLFDASAAYRVSDDFTIHAAVNNLFDKDYTVNLIGPDDRYLTEGRQARIRFSYQF